MSLLPIRDVDADEWVNLLAHWGHGKARPRYIYARDCTKSRFPHCLVMRGPHPSGSSRTDSGFLLDDSGDVIGGVDAIGGKQ